MFSVCLDVSSSKFLTVNNSGKCLGVFSKEFQKLQPGEVDFCLIFGGNAIVDHVVPADYVNAIFRKIFQRKTSVFENNFTSGVEGQSCDICGLIINGLPEMKSDKKLIDDFSKVTGATNCYTVSSCYEYLRSRWNRIFKNALTTTPLNWSMNWQRLPIQKQ